MINKIGNQEIFSVKDDVSDSYESLFKNVIIDSKGSMNVKNKISEVYNGLIKGTQGVTTINNCIIHQAMTTEGLIYLDNDHQLTITNSDISNLIGLKQSAFIFAIKNMNAPIVIRNTKVSKTFSTASLIYLNYAHAKIYDSTIVATNQGSVRRGAASVNLDINHKDIKEFL